MTQRVTQRRATRVNQRVIQRVTQERVTRMSHHMEAARKDRKEKRLKTAASGARSLRRSQSLQEVPKARTTARLRRARHSRKRQLQRIPKPCKRYTYLPLLATPPPSAATTSSPSALHSRTNSGIAVVFRICQYTSVEQRDSALERLAPEQCHIVLLLPGRLLLCDQCYLTDQSLFEKDALVDDHYA